MDASHLQLVKGGADETPMTTLIEKALDAYEKLASQLKAERARQGISVRSMAKLLHRTTQEIHDFENMNGRSASIQLVIDYATALNCTAMVIDQNDGTVITGPPAHVIGLMILEIDAVFGSAV